MPVIIFRPVATPPVRRTESADVLLFLKAGIKDHPGYVLYGDPPRWHLYDPAKHADPAKTHYHAKKTYHVAAVKKLMGVHNTAAESDVHPGTQAMIDEVEDFAAKDQAAASLSASVSMWKQSVVAGKKPTPAQQAALVKVMQTDAHKAAKVIAEVESAVGGHDKLMAILGGNVSAKEPTSDTSHAPVVSSDTSLPDPIGDPAAVDAVASHWMVLGHIPSDAVYRVLMGMGESLGINIDSLVTAYQHKKGKLVKVPSADKKDEALQAAVDHLKEDAQQPDIPAHEKKEDAALVEKLEAATGAPDYYAYAKEEGEKEISGYHAKMPASNFVATAIDDAEYAMGLSGDDAEIYVYGQAKQWLAKNPSMFGLLSQELYGKKYGGVVAKLKSDQVVSGVDPSTVPGVVGWHASLDAGKVPTVAQHQAVTDEGFGGHYNAAKAKHGDKITPLVNQAAENWLDDGVKKEGLPPYKEAQVAQQKVSEILNGKGGHYPGKAAKKLTGDGSWQMAGPVDQLKMIVDLAHQMQAAANASAAVSGWKKTALWGANPSPGEWKAFYALPSEKKAALLDAVKAAHGNWDHLQAPSIPVEPTVMPDAEPLSGVHGLDDKTDALVAGFKAAIESGVVPTTAQTAAFFSLPPGTKDIEFGALYASAGTSPIAAGKVGDLISQAINNLDAEKGEGATQKLVENAKNGAPPSESGQQDGGDVVSYLGMQYKFDGGKWINTASGADYAPGGWKHAMLSMMAGKPPNAASQVKLEMALEAAAKSNEGKPLIGAMLGMAYPPGEHSDGDTKEVDGVTYILKNGRWHKQGDAVGEPAAPVWSVTMHNTSPGHSKYYTMEVTGTYLLKKWGKIGTKGQQFKANYMTHEAAVAAAQAFMMDKAKGGYYVVGHMGYPLDGPQGSTTPEPKAAKPTKMTKAEKQSAVLAAVEAVAIPDFKSMDGGLKADTYIAMTTEIKAAAKSGGLPAVKKLVTYWTDGSVSSKPKVIAAKFETGKCYEASTQQRRVAFWKFCKDIEAALKPGNAPSVGATATPIGNQVGPKEGDTKQGAGGTLVFHNGHWVLQQNPVAGNVKISKSKHGDHVSVMDSWKQMGPQLGSNTGGLYTDKSGQEWYCKFPNDPDVVRNEFLAAKFYQMLGVAVPTLKLVDKNGKLGIASKWVDGLKKGSASDLAYADGTASAFVIDAWLANWDVVGLSNDNLMLGKDGKAVRVDVGGSLIYRAQGGVKGEAFGDDVPELDTLKDPDKNAMSAAVFAGIPKEKMAAGVVQLNKLKPSQIEELCQKVGPGSDAEKAALAKKLIARRAAILKKFGVADQWDKPSVDESKIHVDPSSIKQPIDFVNFSGPGKGVSSKAHVNELNTKDSQALFDFAVKGNLKALKDYHYDAVDKETGASLGKKPITGHPSGKIQEQWAALIQGLQSIAYPPVDSLEMPPLGSFGSLAALAEDVGSFDPSENVTTVAAEHRMGYFMKLAHMDESDAKALLSEVKWVWQNTGTSFGQKLKAAYHAATDLVKKYVHGVQSTGAVNHIWSQGSASHYGVPIKKLTANIYKDAVEVPDGTQMWRWMDDDTAGKSMTKQFLASKPGMILQNTDSMCTSFHETWGDHPHFTNGDGKQVLMRIRCAPGVKVTPTYGTGSLGSEGELTTLPGQRFLVVDIQPGGPKHPQGVFLDVIALPPDPGFVAKLQG
jgi:predicted DNA-binding WGR domain protein